jgi:hypothetical protein
VRVAFVLVAALGTVVLASCSLISTDGLSGGSPTPAPGPEAGLGETGAPPTDAGTGADTATVALDASGAPFLCPSSALFCDDFERSQPDGNGWLTDGTFPNLSSKVALSPTRSLALALLANGDTNWIRRPLTSVPTVVISFGLYAGTPVNGGHEIVKLPFGDVNNWETFTLALKPEGLVVGSQYYDNSPSPGVSNENLGLGASSLFGTGWHTVRFAMDMRNNPRVGSVSVDGATPATVTMASTRPTPTFTGLYVGVTYSAGGQISDTYVDNLVVTSN